MYTVLVEFVIHHKHTDAFVARVRQQASDSLNLEADCHYFDVCIDCENSNQILLYEIYSDAAAFDHHLASAHFQAFDQQVSDWIVSRKITRLNRLPIDQAGN